VIGPSDDDTLSELPTVNSTPLRVVDAGVATTTGLVRAANEDHYGSTGHLFVVADGMGGAAGGALASNLTVEHMLDSQPGVGWVTTLSHVNDLVRTGCNEAGFQGAGSTMVAVVVEEQRCVTLAMGDSRIYRFRDGGLQQLTEDHNLGNLRREEGLDPTVGDARGKPRALTSYMGSPDRSQRIDVGTISALNGDRILLTTDGVHEQLPHSLVSEIVTASSCQEAAQGLVDAADAAGGRDNATAFIIELATDFLIDEDQETQERV